MQQDKFNNYRKFIKIFYLLNIFFLRLLIISGYMKIRSTGLSDKTKFAKSLNNKNTV